MSVSERLENIVLTLHGVQATVQVFENEQAVQDNLKGISCIMTLLSETLNEVTDHISALAFEVEHSQD